MQTVVPLACFLSIIRPPGVQYENALLQVAPVDKSKCPYIKEASDVGYQLFTRHNPTVYQELALNDDERLFASNMDLSAPTVVYFHAFMEQPDDGSGIMLREAYMQRGDTNVIMVDARRLEAGPWYFTAAQNTWYIGRHAAAFIDYLVSRGLQLNSTHLVGHSLGAQAAGVAGSALTTGRVARITGLDPALPLFAGLPREQRLDESDAHFVDVIHTDAGIFGYKEAIGHADFYPNGGRSPQPGCELEVVLPQQLLLNKCDGTERTRGFYSYYLTSHTEHQRHSEEQSTLNWIKPLQIGTNRMKHATKHTQETKYLVKKSKIHTDMFEIDLRKRMKRNVLETIVDINEKAKTEEPQVTSKNIDTKQGRKIVDNVNAAYHDISKQNDQTVTSDATKMKLANGIHGHNDDIVATDATKMKLVNDIHEHYDKTVVTDATKMEPANDIHQYKDTTVVVDATKMKLPNRIHGHNDNTVVTDATKMKLPNRIPEHNDNTVTTDVTKMKLANDIHEQNDNTVVADARKMELATKIYEHNDNTVLTDATKMKLPNRIHGHNLNTVVANARKMKIHGHIDKTKQNHVKKTSEVHSKKRQKRFLQLFSRDDNEDSFIFKALNFLVKNRKNVVPIISVVRDINTLVKSGNGELNHVTREQNQYVGVSPPVLPPVTYSLELGNESRVVAFMKRLFGLSPKGDRLTVGSG